jgi:cell fate (sporulation/competence/biofilm development) regulator YlbF (YheA/YmcA/DUF963 family)
LDPIQEKAREIGRLLSQTEEYKAVKRAHDRMGEDRDTITAMNRLADLEDQITMALRSGREPEAALQEEFAQLAEQVQQKTAYQAVIAAQTNFDRLMGRINEEIGRGIEAGEQSRIILP